MAGLSKNGGARIGSGRKPGAKTAKTSDIALRAAVEGVTPIEVMLATMRVLWRDALETNDLKLKVAACAIAEKAAPYCHPRLAAIEHSGEVTRVSVIRAPAISPDAQTWAKQHVPAHINSKPN